MTLSNLSQFSYQDKFRMSPDNVLIFTGQFINSPFKDSIGKNLYIPLTENHPAFTFKITGQAWPGITGISSLMVKFSSSEEREAVATCDFTNEVFYVDVLPSSGLRPTTN